MADFLKTEIYIDIIVDLHVAIRNNPEIPCMLYPISPNPSNFKTSKTTNGIVPLEVCETNKKEMWPGDAQPGMPISLSSFSILCLV